MTAGVFFPASADLLYAGGGENVCHRVARQFLFNVRIPPQIPFERLVEWFRRSRAAAFAIRIENDLFGCLVDSFTLTLPLYSRTDQQ
jgi:hypothetical protein